MSEPCPGVFRFKIPLENNPLGYINSYLIKTSDGCILVDSGWNTEDAFTTLLNSIEGAGAALEDIRYLIITHIHPDHYGLAGRIKELSGATLILHEIEHRFLDSRYQHFDELLEATEGWLRINGVPLQARSTLQRASLEILGLVSLSTPDYPVFGNERICLGEVELEILWTPGHSPGHICLYERQRKILFSGDHVLEKISPNVSMNTQTQSNPLIDYQNSLRQLKDLDVSLILPGHGDPFSDLNGRISSLLEHHEVRLNEILTACKNSSKTAYDIAKNTTWFKPWDELPPFSQRTAVTETLSHLELLLSRGLLTKTTKNGVFYYSEG
jgi:glyoxylase-like metal-dependent hydrolase (beta-lactamase superfamily II)